jgi:hypothetical protein
MTPDKYLSLRHARADWERVKCEVAYVRVLILAQRLREAMLRDEAAGRLSAPDGGAVKFRDDQPRLPAGQTGGGQWTSGAGGSATAGDAPAAGDKPDQTTLLQIAPLVPIVADKAAEVALYLYLYWASRNSRERTAVLEYNAREFLPGAERADPAIGNRTLNQEDVDASCPRNELVQDLTDKAAETVRTQWYNLKPAEFGTRVHSELKDSIVRLNDPNLIPEKSAIKSIDADYGDKGSIRIDVFENVGDGTVCVYDIKTGQTGLSLARMQEIANNAHSLYPGTKKLLVIEKRPK